MKNFHLQVLSLCFMLLTACQKQDESHSNETSIYVSSVKDFSTQEPFHEVLIEQNDTLWKHDFWGKEKTFAKTTIQDLDKSDSEITYHTGDEFQYRENFTLFKDLHLFMKKSEIFSYVKTSKGQDIKSESFSSLVDGKFFKTTIPALKTPNSVFDIKEIIYFNKNQLTYFWEYYYADVLMHTETESEDISYFEVDKQLFIVPSTQDNPYPIYQVVQVEDAELKLAQFTDFESKVKTYELIKEMETKEYTSYSLCKDAFQSLYYVGDDVRFAKGMEYLLNYLQEDAPKTDGLGFINLHFTINCNAEVGRFGLELLDKNYQPTQFDPKLIKHIVDKVKLLNEWEDLDKVNYKGAKDVKMFFLIQAANQKITEVCP